MKLAVLGLLWLLLPGAAMAENRQVMISQEQIENLDIKVAPLSASQQVPLLYAPAKVVVPANHEVLVSSSVPGLVTQVLANIGDSVRKGQVLAQLTSPELVAMQQAFLTAGSEHALADMEQRRDQHLLQEGVIAERRWQETQTVHGSKSAKADEARQLLLLAGMTPADINDLAKTRNLHNQLLIRAPMDGVILERLATLGSRLDTQAPLFRIADLSELWLEIDVPQERVAILQVGDQVVIEDTPITAKIALLGQSVQHENQTVTARAVVEAKAPGLRVGQHLNVKVVQSAKQNGFRVPNTALAQSEGHTYVFVRNAQGFAVTEVTVAGKQDVESLIIGPLTGTEQIAVKGAVALKANWLGLGAGE